MIFPPKFEMGIDFLNEYNTLPRCYSAFIAGGAVRDFLTDKPINDIDVYTSAELTPSHIWCTTNLSTVRRVKRTHTNPYDLFKIAEFELVDGTEMQLISLHEWVNTPASATTSGPIEQRLVETFDTGICMCYFNSNNEIVMSDKFKKDINNNTITLYPSLLTPRQIIRSINYHIPKIVNKFNDHKVVIDYTNRVSIYS